MANFTEKAIKESFIRLLEERPLSEITIKDIVVDCGINRNSFYYHFQDMPALIEQIIKEEADAIIQKYPTVDTVVACFDALIEFASHRKRAIMHIYRSVNREVFERNLMELSDYFVRMYINTVFPGDEISAQNRETVLNYYKCVSFGLVIGWLNDGMTEEYARSVRRIFALKKDFSQEISQMLQAQL